MPTILGDGTTVSWMLVTRKALLQRVNRLLAKRGQTIRTARSLRIAREFGDYFAVAGNSIIERNIDLDAYARELDCLAAWEVVEIEPKQDHSEGCTYNDAGAYVPKYGTGCPACNELAREYARITKERKEGKQ